MQLYRPLIDVAGHNNCHHFDKPQPVLKPPPGHGRLFCFHLFDPLDELVSWPRRAPTSALPDLRLTAVRPLSRAYRGAVLLSIDSPQRDHVKPNTPFLLAAEATAKWPARRDWAKTDFDAPQVLARDLSSAQFSASSNGHVNGHVNGANIVPVSQPNLAALRRYADQVVPVADTARRQYSEFERDERPLGEVLDLWESGEGSSLYVKDWHLVAEIEERGGRPSSVYTPPPCFMGGL